MRTLTALATVALLALTIPSLASAQTARPARPGVAKVQRPRVVQNFERRIARGAKAGRVTSDERVALRAKMQELRAEMRALRANGGQTTRVDRLKVRKDVRQMNRSIIKANRGR